MPSAKVAILSQNDDYGRTYVSAFKIALGEVADRMIVAQATYEVTEPMISSQIETLRASNADVLMNFSLGKFTAQAIQRARELGWKPLQFVPYAVSSPKVLSQGGSPGELAGLISTGLAKTPSDPAWADDPEYKDYLAWIGKYYAGGDPTDDLNVLAYVSAGLLTHVLSAAGDDLSRENIIRIASNLRDVRVPMLLPGITANTSPTKLSNIQKAPASAVRWNALGKVDGIEIWEDVEAVASPGVYSPTWNSAWRLPNRSGLDVTWFDAFVVSGRSKKAGVTVDTSPADYRPMKRRQLLRFDGTHWSSSEGLDDDARGPASVEEHVSSVVEETEMKKNGDRS
jgi:hypothetical protein